MPDLLAALARAPELENAPSLAGALTSLAEDLVVEGRGHLPAAASLPPLALARWLQRQLIAHHGRFLPLLHLRQTTLDQALLEACAPLAAGGLIFLEGPPEPLPRLEGTWVLGPGEGEPLPLRRADAARIAWEDRHHALIVDPALAALRRSLLSHCRGASVVHLEGESGVGRAELARWAHGVLDDRPLSTLAGEGGRPEPGQWLLVEELAELGPTGREQLKAALRARQQPPPPPPQGRRGPRRPHHSALKPILGRSGALAAVLHRAAEVAPAELPVLVLGDPGTGKESLARALHEMSGRRGPFIPVDLGALPARLAESELFGHVRGAFTGAERDREGAFRAADGGTLFLDELGNLPLALQVKLLRVLQERRVRPLGADRDQPVDVRVLAATNADLEGLVRQGRFRADLLGRLNAVTLRLPPLRERAEDILLLAERFLEAARGAPGPGLSEDAAQALLEHDWPGNIRELSNVVRLAAALTPSDEPIPVEALGPLAPGQRRPVPLLVTSSGEEARWDLDRATTMALRAVSLRLPPLRDRGALSIRSHVLSGLGGRPITPKALAFLERHPWWGNLPRLHAALAALRATGAEPITADTLSAHMPHLLRAESAAPIRLLIGPVLEADGSVGGLREDFHQASVLIGRARSLADLRELARGPGGARAAAWLREIEALAGPVPPALLSLALLPRLSRAHALITRDAQGLRAHALSGARLPLEAGPLGQPLQPVAPGASLPMGEAGELRVRRLHGDLYLQIFAFQGELAFAEQAPAAARAAQAMDSVGSETAALTQAPTLAPRPSIGPQPTLGWRPSAPSRRPGLPSRAAPGFSVTPMNTNTSPINPPKGGGRVWALTAREAQALAAILAAHPGGQFKAWVKHQLPALAAEPGLSRLALFLERAPRLAQYTARLLDHPNNSAAREALVAALLATPEPRERLARLPKGLREAVTEALEARLAGGMALPPPRR